MTPRRSLESQRRKARFDFWLDTCISVAALMVVMLTVLAIGILFYTYLTA